MAQGTAVEGPPAGQDSQVFAWVRTGLSHADPGAVAGALLRALGRGAFKRVGEEDIRSVEVSLRDRTLTITGREEAVREVSGFIREMDNTADVFDRAQADRCDEEEATADREGEDDTGWTDDPNTYTAPPLHDLSVLRADFWPEDESVDDFIAMVRESRRSRRSRDIE